MRTTPGREQVRISSLSELDALVGETVMGEMPEVRWEDSYARLQFDSLDEALDALRDPIIQGFIPADQRCTTVLEEVREFPLYSSTLIAAWKVIEHLGNYPLELRREQQEWAAAFGKGAAEVRAKTAPLAICLAALLLKGVEVLVDRDLSAASGLM